MKEIKTQVQELIKLLENIKKSHSDFIDREINKTINECTGGGNFDETKKVDYLGEDFKRILSSKGNKNLHSFQKDLINHYKSVLDITINLNKLLDKPFKKILSVEDTKNKEVLVVKDVELLYNLSKSQQQTLRIRLKNPLPSTKQSTNSKSSNSKIYYNKVEVDNWFKNYF